MRSGGKYEHCHSDEDELTVPDAFRQEKAETAIAHPKTVLCGSPRRTVFLLLPHPAAENSLTGRLLSGRYLTVIP